MDWKSLVAGGGLEGSRCRRWIWVMPVGLVITAGARFYRPHFGRFLGDRCLPLAKTPVRSVFFHISPSSYSSPLASLRLVSSLPNEFVASRPPTLDFGDQATILRAFVGGRGCAHGGRDVRFLPGGVEGELLLLPEVLGDMVPMNSVIVMLAIGEAGLLLPRLLRFRAGAVGFKMSLLCCLLAAVVFLLPCVELGVLAPPRVVASIEVDDAEMSDLGPRPTLVVGGCAAGHAVLLPAQTGEEMKDIVMK